MKSRVRSTLDALCMVETQEDFVKVGEILIREICPLLKLCDEMDGAGLEITYRRRDKSHVAICEWYFLLVDDDGSLTRFITAEVPLSLNAQRFDDWFEEIFIPNFNRWKDGEEEPLPVVDGDGILCGIRIQRKTLDFLEAYEVYKEYTAVRVKP